MTHPHQRPCVFALAAVHYRGHDRAVGRGVAAERIRDETARCAALSFQQFPEETFGLLLIAPGLHEDVDHVAVLVDRPPEILLAPLDGHEQFVQVPGVIYPTASSPKTAGKAVGYWTRQLTKSGHLVEVTP